MKKYEIRGIEYTFKMDSVDGTEVLTATYTQNGESSTIWTVDATNLPESEKEAADYISDFDWAVEQSSELDSSEDIVKKTIINNAHTGETTEVKDINELDIVKGVEKSVRMIELANGTWLRSMGDGRYYDEQGNPYATVETALFDEGGELNYSTEFHGYIRV